MMVTRLRGTETWIDLNSPTKEELDSLIEARNLDPIIVKDLFSPTPKQYAKSFENGIYAVLHLPFFKHSPEESLEQEIDFIISDKTLITARYESIDALHSFGKQMEVNEIFNKNNGEHLFFSLMKEIYFFLFSEIEYLRDWIKEVEKQIFNGHEKKMVWSLSVAVRNILSFKRIIYPHKSVFETIALAAKNNFDENFNKEIGLLIREWEHLMLEVDNISETLNGLRDTNNSILSAKQNETMKQLAIIGVVMFPITIVGQIFGMSILYFPLKDSASAFWIILGIMFSVLASSLTYVKVKKWT